MHAGESGVVLRWDCEGSKSAMTRVLDRHTAGLEVTVVTTTMAADFAVTTSVVVEMMTLAASMTGLPAA